MQGLLFILLMAISSYSMSLSLSEAINEAGRQRMLSQKIAKAYFMQGIKRDSSSAASQIKNSTYRFEHNLDMLKKSALTSTLQSEIQAIENLWMDYKRMIGTPIDQKNAVTVLEYSEKILAKCHALVVKLENMSNKKSAKIINVSGQQRMLSQQIAKNYLAASWGIEDERVQDKFNSDFELFSLNLEMLLDNSENTDEIKKELIKVKNKMAYVSKVFQGSIKLSNSRSMLIVTGTTNSILHKMDDITRRYVSLVNKQ